MHSKPAKYDIKYFCLCDVETSYLHILQVYMGKDTQQNASDKNIGVNVVFDLAKVIENTGCGSQQIISLL